MSRSPEIPAGPEILANSVHIKWEISQDRIPRLSNNLRILFEEKNGTVYGVIQKGNPTLMLGDSSLVKGREPNEYFDVQFRKRDYFSKLPIRKQEDLVAIFSDKGWGADINYILNTNFDEKESNNFKEILSKRALTLILNTIYQS